MQYPGNGNTSHLRSWPRSTRVVRSARRAVLAALALVMVLVPALSAHAQSLEQLFSKSTPGSKVAVDHSAWDKQLKAYVVSESPYGVNLVHYAKWKAEGHTALKAYLGRLEATDVAALDRPEQFAFWANLYNAKTIDVVLDHYPVKSIREISINEGLFGFLKTTAGFGGPWKAKIMTVGGQRLSLDDVEHAILRPVFKDPRVHYAVNCASIGCPNLGREAFTGARLEALLDAGAYAFVNRDGAKVISGGKLKTSSIYDWFAMDFGGSASSVIAHVKKYAKPELREKLGKVNSIADYSYDWSLNDVKSR